VNLWISKETVEFFEKIQALENFDLQLDGNANFGRRTGAVEN
jgi:hypothetical protein